ncbi:MAG TPA: ABC transporter ATP-binding protein [Bacteroidales bacterium]|nr:ABC transporter ATP-binding protein [Bacteroidales bacterium]
MTLKISNLNKKYNDIRIFTDFSMEINPGLITCILGPSGCGKTTLLNIIGGITSADSGELTGFEGRGMSYIFQDPRLLPWKTVRGNIEFVISGDISPAERKEHSDRLLRSVGLRDFAGYYPSQLSGGMRQRVSIARAFACSSDIILMDEPLKGLDITLKQNIIKWFSGIWASDKRTVIFVTHDIDEAIMLGDEIIVLSGLPAQITAHEKISRIPGSQNNNNPQLFRTRQVIINALGNITGSHQENSSEIAD